MTKEFRKQYDPSLARERLHRGARDGEIIRKMRYVPRKDLGIRYVEVVESEYPGFVRARARDKGISLIPN